MPASSGTHIQTPNTLKLETVQRRSARRIMQNYIRHASVTTMLQNLDLPTLQQRRRHSKIIMLYRIRHKLANVPTTTYITPDTRNTQYYNLPYARTEVYKSSFFPSTIKLWNNLQPAIINSTTIPQLRQALQSTPTAGRRGATLSATYLGGHLTFTSNHRLDNTRRRLCRLLPRCRQRLAPPIAHWGI